MPKHNPSIANFYHTFSNEEAEEIILCFDHMCIQHNVCDDKIITTALADITRQLRKDTGNPKFDDLSVQQFVANNIKLYKEFISYVNGTIGVKFNKKQKCVDFGVEYWYYIAKEDPKQKLFRKYDFPNFEAWSKIIQAHKPGNVVVGHVGSLVDISIVVKDEPFDPEAVDDWDRRWNPELKKSPFDPKKLFTL